MKKTFIKLECYIPETHLDCVKQAIFSAGAGTIGDYDCCSWETTGRGQFRPLAGSSPFFGVRNKVEYVDEIKLETVCPIEKIADIIIALKAAHPYETPAYQYWEVNG
jgi:hypothetical protein